MGGNIGKLVIAVLLFAAAGLVLLRFLSSEDAPRIAEDAKPLTFVCTACEKHFQLTYEESQEATVAAARPTADGGRQVRGRRSDGDRRPNMIACRECGKATAVAASHCEEHDVYYPAVDADGVRGACPKCP